ncbi:MAG: MlaA family lipoprotein, partial [Burkholderiales bacterium]
MMARMIRKMAAVLLPILFLSGLAGCATTGPTDPRDPIEGYNRAIYAFNDGFDTVLAKPVSTVYRDVLPDPVRYWIRNFFSNLYDPWTAVNNLAQGKPLDALQDLTRFVVNSTFGLLGFVDFATEMGIEKHDEDLGQTLGRWGMDEGPYLVWPFWGSSTLRDSAALPVDFYMDPVLRHRPVWQSNTLLAIRFTSKRADLLDASRILEEAALDKYVFQRDAYLQRRRSQVYDGNPPRAQRETPRAEAQDAEQPVVPSASPSSAAPSADAEQLGAAAKLLEDPASHSATGGG